MRVPLAMFAVSVAAMSLAACAGSPAKNDPNMPALFDVTPDGGFVSNADAEYAGEAAMLAEEHCRKTKREMHVTGLDADRHAIAFSCEKPG